MKRPPSRIVSPVGALAAITGASFTERTSKRAVLLAEAPSGSVAVNVMLAAPCQYLFGITTFATWSAPTWTRSDSPAGSSSPLPFFFEEPWLIGLTLNVHLSSLILWSASFTKSASLIGWKCFFSSIDWSRRSRTNSGASFTDSTVKVTSLLSLAPSGSVTVKRIFSEPFQLAFGGVTVTLCVASIVTRSSFWPSIFHFRRFLAWSRSSTKWSSSIGLNEPFSLMVWPGISFMTGGSFTETTVNVAVVRALAPDGSVTVNVTFSEPFHILFGAFTVTMPVLDISTLRSLLPVKSIFKLSKWSSGSDTSSDTLNGVNSPFS